MLCQGKSVARWQSILRTDENYPIGTWILRRNPGILNNSSLMSHSAGHSSSSIASQRASVAIVFLLGGIVMLACCVSKEKENADACPRSDRFEHVKSRRASSSHPGR